MCNELIALRYQGSSDMKCSDCDAQLLQGERSCEHGRFTGSICCCKEKVQLLRDSDDDASPWYKGIVALWHDAQSPLGKTLRKFSRQLNNALALASSMVGRPKNAPGRH
eukprot:5752572-Prymnesium_polylepis.1